MPLKLSIKEAEEEMRKLRKEVSDFAEKIPRIQENITPYLKEKRNKGDYVEYVAIGAGLVEFLLKNLFTVLLHHDNFVKLVNKEIITGNFSQDVEIEFKTRDGTDPLGGLIRELKKSFKFDEKYPKLCEHVEELNKIRKNTIHYLIERYEGAVDRANKDLKLYCDKQPIELTLEVIMIAQNKIADEQYMVYKSIFNTEPSIELRKGNITQ